MIDRGPVERHGWRFNYAESFTQAQENPLDLLEADFVCESDALHGQVQPSRRNHTGNHLSAEAGATLRELMERMGHSTTRAALIYLHATDERQRAVADAVDAAARAALGKANKGRNRTASGTDLARRGKKAL
jgi:hypothetical protein